MNKAFFTEISVLRRRIFAELAAFAYSGRDPGEAEELPYRILREAGAMDRESIFKERAVAAERLRMAMGLSVCPADCHAPLKQDFATAAQGKPREVMPLVQVIPFACAACPTHRFWVSDGCKACLAHPCVAACPVKAVSLEGDRAQIDQGLCTRCGRCKESCPYGAVLHQKRPCAAACGVGAIGSDGLGRAVILQDRCVSCGLCIVHCPFGAIGDKSQILQLILAQRSGRQTVALAAPAMVGQFGPEVSPEEIAAAMEKLGFTAVLEVALGADEDAAYEAEHFLQNVPEKQPFLATSCCPSWYLMATRQFPALADCFSTHPTPMVRAARRARALYPEAALVFLSPCSAKKMEAALQGEGLVEFVLTFEELLGMMVAKGIDFTSGDRAPYGGASKAGRSYPVSGGVTEAIVSCIRGQDGAAEVNTEKADGLAGCRRLLQLAKAGKRKGYLLEGMACPGGCVGGGGTLMPPARGARAAEAFRDGTERELPSSPAP